MALLIAVAAAGAVVVVADPHGCQPYLRCAVASNVVNSIKSIWLVNL